MISCEDAIRQMWSYLENELPSEDRAAIEAHMDICRRCCGEVEFVKELEGVLSRSGELEVPRDVHARMEAYLEALEG